MTNDLELERPFEIFQDLQGSLYLNLQLSLFISTIKMKSTL